ncbi:MAG: GtrA family protein [Firmicutes bacterium]|nr:GtrA family protein [Bacillota bacterium]
MPNSFARLTRRRGVRQFVKFGIVGASGFVVNLIFFTILQRLTALPLLLDNSVGFMAGGVSNYFLNRLWTFRSTGHAAKEGAQFLAVSFVSLLVSDGVFYLLDRSHPLHQHHHTVWFLATLSSIFVNFFLNKYWTFKHVR